MCLKKSCLVSEWITLFHLVGGCNGLASSLPDHHVAVEADLSLLTMSMQYGIHVCTRTCVES